MPNQGRIAFAGLVEFVSFGLLLLASTGAPAWADASCVDADGDGVCVEADCDDANPDCALSCSDTDDDGVCDDQDNCIEIANAHQGLRVKLNAPLVPDGNVWAFALSPDGRTVVYRAEVDTPGTEELFSVPLRGGPSTKVTGPFAPGVDALQFSITPDNATVLYRAPQDIPNGPELYSAPVGGGSFVKLSVPGGGDLQAFAESPDSSRVVFIQYALASNYRLYSVPTGGGTPVQLSHLPPTVDVLSFAVSADSSRVVFLDWTPTEGKQELYSVPIGGGAMTKLNSPLVAGGYVGDFQLTPDGSSVVYRANQDSASVSELYRVPTGGGLVTKLNAPTVGSGVLDDWRIGPNGAFVVYQAPKPTAPALKELYGVPIGGGTPVKYVEGTIAAFAVSADSSRIVYRRTGTSSGLYSASVAGSTPVQIAGTVTQFGIAPDSARVAYVASVTGGAQLMSVPIDGGPAIALSYVGTSAAITDSFAFSPDGSTVVYLIVGQDVPEVFELYAVPTGGGPVTRLNGPLPVNGDVLAGFAISADGSRVVFRVDQETDQTFEVYSAPLGAGGIDSDADGAGAACDCDDTNALCGLDCEDADGDGACSAHDCDDAAAFCSLVCTDADGDAICNDLDNCVELANPDQFSTRLNGPLAAEGDVTYQATTLQATISGDSSTVIFHADQEADGLWGVYSAPAAGGPPTRLNQPLASSAPPYLLSPDGTTVVYRQSSELYSVPAHGGTTVKLNGALVPGGGSVDGMDISSDSSTVVYWADQEVANHQELFRVPIGGGAVAKINGPLVVGGAVQSDFVVTAGGFVVYRVDQVSNEVFELYSAPLGGGPPVKLSPTPAASGDVISFNVSPDGSHVVYLADQDLDSFDELYSVPIGGGTVTKLNGPLVAGGDVSNFKFKPDSSRVAYLADQNTNGLVELFSVPIAGGAAVSLSATLTNSVSSTYTLSPPNGDFAVFTSGTLNNVVELFSTPIGGGTPTKLNGPLPMNGDVDQFRVSPDGSRVVYLADQDTNDVHELFSVPIGGGAPVKLSQPGYQVSYVSGSVIPAILVTSDSSHVYYREDHGPWELYRAPIGGGATIKINGPLVPDGGVTDFGLSPDESVVLFIAGQDAEGATRELYVAPAAGGVVSRISDPPVLNGHVNTFKVTPDSSRVVWVGDTTVDEQFELFSRRITGDAADADGDGRGGACDCSALDGSVWELPGEVPQLNFLGDKSTLSWGAPPALGGLPGSVAYDTLRSAMPEDFGAGDCIEANGSDLEARDASVPSGGTVYYYIVRARNACGEGSVGTDSAGNPRPPAVSCGP